MTWWQFLFLWLTQQGLNYEDDDEEDEEDDDGGDDHGGGGDDGGCGDNDHEDHEDGFTQQGLHDEMNLKLWNLLQDISDIAQIRFQSIVLQIIVDRIFFYCRSIFETDKLQQQIANAMQIKIKITNTNTNYKYK